MTPGSTSIRPPGRWSRAARWWLAAGAFVVGVLVGAVLVGLLSEGSPVPAAGSGEPLAPSTSNVASSPGTSGATVEIMVTEACLSALSAAEDAYSTIDEIVDAVRELSVTRLDEIIRRLQPLQSRLRDDIDDCRVITRLPGGAIVSSGASNSPVIPASSAPPTTAPTS